MDSVPFKGRIVTASAAVALLIAVWVPASRAFLQLPEPGAVQLERIGQLHFDHQVADLWVHAGFAYLGSHACGKGVSVVRVLDPVNPTLVAVIPPDPEGIYEDVAVLDANTLHFQGSLLAIGVQRCGPQDRGPRGVEFWNVSDPAQPRRLGFHGTGTQSAGVHELSMVQRGGHVYALLAVPFSERRDGRGDFRIVDASDPEHPEAISDWSATRSLKTTPSSGQGASSAIFVHSTTASNDGLLAYVSLWDAGVAMLDISDVATPKLLGRTGYEPHEEGNGHSSWPIDSRNLLLVADEDFTPNGGTLEVTSPANLVGSIQFVEGELTNPLCRVGEVTADVTVVQRSGCNPGDYAPDAAGRVALATLDSSCHERAIALASEAGVKGMLFTSPPPMGALLPPHDHSAEAAAQHTGRLPAQFPVGLISEADGSRIRAAIGNGQQVNVRMMTDPDNTWGFLRIFDTSDLAAPRQLATLRTPKSRACFSGDPLEEWYTVHNPFVVGDTAYLAWYSDGVRVVDIARPTNPREIGAYVPPDEAGPGNEILNPLVWGIFVKGDLIYLSDSHLGLHVVRVRPR